MPLADGQEAARLDSFESLADQVQQITPPATISTIPWQTVISKLDAMAADMAHYVQRVDMMESSFEATRLELHDTKVLLGNALDRIEQLEQENAKWTTNDFREALDEVVNEGTETFALNSGGTTPRTDHEVLDHPDGDLDYLAQAGPAQDHRGWDSELRPSVISSFSFADHSSAQATAQQQWSLAGGDQPGLGPTGLSLGSFSRLPPTMEDLRQQVNDAVMTQLVPTEMRHAVAPPAGSQLTHHNIESVFWIATCTTRPSRCLSASRTRPSSRHPLGATRIRRYACSSRSAVDGRTHDFNGHDFSDDFGGPPRNTIQSKYCKPWHPIRQ